MKGPVNSAQLPSPRSATHIKRRRRGFDRIQMGAAPSLSHASASASPPPSASAAARWPAQNGAANPVRAQRRAMRAGAAGGPVGGGLGAGVTVLSTRGGLLSLLGVCQAQGMGGVETPLGQAWGTAESRYGSRWSPGRSHSADKANPRILLSHARVGLAI